MLFFVTDNEYKLLQAKLSLDPINIHFEQKSLPLIEIQSTSIEEIAIQKAKDAFKILNQPLIVKDDGWFIPSLNGFPGPYMKYVNDWFTVDDFINLLNSKQDRSVTFFEVVCFIDEEHLEMFSSEIHGEILLTPKGNAKPFTELCTLRKDKKTMAECFNENLESADDRPIWKDFAKWYGETILKK